MSLRDPRYLLLCIGVLSLSTDVSGQFGSPADESSLSSDGASEAEVANLRDKIETESSRHALLKTELDGLGTQRNALRDRLGHSVKTLYRMTRTGVLPGQGGFSGLIQRITRVKRLERLVKASLSEFQRVVLRSKKLEYDEQNVASSLDKSRARLFELQQRAEQADRQNPFQTGQNRDVSSGVGSSSRRSNGEEFYGIRAVEGDDSSGFVSLRGRLAIPVTGDFVVRDARREESDGPGLEFQTGYGAEVRAAAAGKVGFSDRYGSYGKLVIIDHGDNYYTVYGGLDVVEVRVGDDLSQNARIGIVGNKTSPPALFFEVRRGTKTLPPRPWFGL
jgi:murein DD-endopeptidase MepM/ murein hydrolase activator NlpD